MISFSTTTTCLASVFRFPADWALRRNACTASSTAPWSATTASPRAAVQSRSALIFCDHFGIVDQRLHRVIPIVVDRQLGIAFALLEKAVRLHQLQRIGRRGQDDRHEVVGIERDGTDELFELLGRRRLRGVAGSGGRLRRGQRRDDQRNTSCQRHQPR